MKDSYRAEAENTYTLLISKKRKSVISNSVKNSIVNFMIVGHKKVFY